MRPVLLLVLVLAGGAFALPGAAGSTPVRAAVDFSVQISGPQTVSIDPCCVPPKFPYTFTFNYVGPALDPPPADARTRFTIRLSEFTHSMETEWSTGAGVVDCQTQEGPQGRWGPSWTSWPAP